VIYVANPSTERIRAAMRARLLGCMTTPAQGNAVPDRAWWAADNGVFGKGYPGDEAWLAWLASRTADPDRCLFVTAPDVVGDAWRTLSRSWPFLPLIRDLGYPAAFVAQDGIEDTGVPWDDLDVLFLGGTDAFKLGEHAAELVHLARSHGKWVHVGRVNSRVRWDRFEQLGCDSADGTFLAFGPDKNLDECLSWRHPRTPGHSWRKHREGLPCGACPGRWEEAS
jgi:hypothetical protein